MARRSDLVAASAAVLFSVPPVTRPAPASTWETDPACADVGAHASHHAFSQNPPSTWEKPARDDGAPGSTRVFWAVASSSVWIYRADAGSRGLIIDSSPSAPKQVERVAGARKDLFGRRARPQE